MPNSKHFYGVSRGETSGIQIDESTLHPDATYWRIGAQGARAALIKLIGEDETYDAIAAVWHRGRTWHDICIDTEAALAFARNQVNLFTLVSDSIQPKTISLLTDSAYMQAELGTHVIVSGGEVLELEARYEQRTELEDDYPF